MFNGDNFWAVAIWAIFIAVVMSYVVHAVIEEIKFQLEKRRIRKGTWK